MPHSVINLIDRGMSSTSELKVTFFPPLYLQRRIWILDNIRRDQVKSVLDIGCGEGELLNALRQPAPWLEAHPDLTDDGKDEFVNIHPTHIAGLDISDDVEFASQATAPSPSNLTHEMRWEPLQVKIWKGGLEDLNAEFVDFECIVASEVIEHLPEHIVPELAPTILGVYHPRLFLLTTPSFTFNARFTAPDAPADARSGYLDPTGRTTRIFRHHDHKFEWTVEEFRQWCDRVAEEWGYVVEISSVGTAVEVDRWGRDEKLGGASQVARFTRLDDNDSTENREKRSRSMRERASEKTKHELYATHLHPVHPRSRKPGSLQEIGDSVKVKMETSRGKFTRLEELWFELDISALCGGWIELLSKAIEDHPKLTLHRNGTEKRSNWMVELIDSVQEQDNLWLAEEENSLEYIPPGFLPEDDDDTDSSGAEGDVSESELDGEGEEEDDWMGSEGSGSVADRVSGDADAAAANCGSKADESNGTWSRGTCDPQSTWADQVET